MEEKKIIERIKCNDITDVIANAMEMADDLEDVIILYQRKDPGGAGFLHAGKMTTAELNWHIDKLKAFLLNTLNCDEIK